MFMSRVEYISKDLGDSELSVSHCQRKELQIEKVKKPCGAGLESVRSK